MSADDLADALLDLCDGAEVDGKPSAATKRLLLEVALQLGPDRCQALYHAVVYMTKVAA